MITIDTDLNKKRKFNDNDLVCYCFEYTKKNIMDDFVANGFSKIIEKIKKAKRINGCNCEVKNPNGK